MDETIGTEIDGYAVVAGHWPLVGPFSPVRTGYASQALTSLVSYLGCAVHAEDGLADGEDVDRLLAAAREALAALPAVMESAQERRRAWPQ
ncbi:hypothetical protein [Cryptosporangium sp. NPDC051539]|uniref:hypothetical protein n=1 Tax=Cryptosporangium sp. NPDC051539 TaxID=3363962 RepID=UPI003787E1EF